ncbi:MAG: polyprenyl synthetase family protein [Candidatus Omnitrophica bacterium]|nr:polyprenyl synthetase family protein [Candidatus Omnitrophota bacterium]
MQSKENHANIAPMLEKIRNQIEKNLHLFLNQRLKFYQLDKIHPNFHKHLVEFSLRKGKRVRPLLLVLAYSGYQKTAKPISQSIYRAAASIELLHNFMLVHDDIIDCSVLRRSKPTLHKLLEHATPCAQPKKLGVDLGIIAGDLLSTLSVEALLSVDEKPERKQTALAYFTQTTIYTAIGELIDTVYGFEPLKKISEEKVYLNYTLKTSRYTFEGPLIIGAALAGAPNSEIKKLSELSILAGQAFQIQDDVIGIFGTEKSIGKSILSDLEESKKTLLVCHAFHNLKGKNKKQFIAIFTKKHKTLDDLSEIKKLLLKFGSLQYCLTETSKRLTKALKLLNNSKLKPAVCKEISQVINSPFKPSVELAKERGLNF